MATSFVYEGRTWASVPSLPIRVGSSVIVLSSNVGVIQAGLRWIRHVGIVDGLYPAWTPEHHWWFYRHSADYQVPNMTDVRVSVVFSPVGNRCLYLYTDLLHVIWLSSDVHPTVLPVRSPART